MAIKIDEVIKAYGAYYKDEGQNLKRILKLLTHGTVTPKYMTPIVTDDTVYRLSNVFMKSIIQPFQKDWTPKGTVTFIPNEIRLYHIKADDDIVPSDIEGNWLGFLAGENKTRKEWPFVKYLVEHLYLPQINSDMEKHAYFKGIRKEPVAGVKAEAIDSMNGLLIQLQEGVDSVSNPINFAANIGILDKTKIFDQIEAFEDAISETGEGDYSEIKMNIFVSPVMLKAYLRDKRSQGMYDVKSNKEIDNEVDFSPREVIALPSMAGCQYMFATPKSNLLHLTKRGKDKSSFKLEERHRVVSVMTDWWEGVGIGCNAIVWTTLPKTVTAT